MANREHSTLTGADLHAPGAHAAQHKGDGSDPIANATTSVAGLESAADKTKLNGITTGATDDTAVNAHIADTSDAHDASAISFVPAGTIASTNVQAAIEEAASEGGGGGGWTAVDASETVKGIAELATQAETNTGTDDTRIVTPLKLKTNVDLHINDTTDAHDASAISIADSANQYTATNAEDALAEVLDALQAHEADTTDAHDASAISFVPAGTIAATTVQAAIEEVASEAGGSGSIAVEEDGSEEGAAIDRFDFTTGLNVSVSGSQATISADATPAARTMVKLASDVSNSTSTLADVTDLSFAVTSGVIYHFHFRIIYTSQATATGTKFALNGPGTPTGSYNIEHHAGGSAVKANVWNSSLDLSTSGTTSANMVYIDGYVSSTSSGTVIARFASEAPGTNNQITVKAGSTVEWWAGT